MPHPKERQADGDDIGAKQDNGRLRAGITAKDEASKRHHPDKEKEDSVDIGEPHIKLFGEAGDDEVVGPPKGEEDGKREDVSEEGRQNTRKHNRQIINRRHARETGNLEFQNQQGHNDGEDAISQRLQPRQFHMSLL